MARKGGWRRIGSRGHFHYVDARSNAITDEEKLERIRALVIPPAWQDVWISPSPTAKLQATGVDAAGRRQYLYHADFRAQQEQAKFDRLIRFAERVPDLRAAMAVHMDHDALDRLRAALGETELQGVVTEVLAGGNYKVKCGENHEVLARLNGKMRQYRIRVIAGDRVTVGVSPYDLKRGLITYRAK